MKRLTYILAVFAVLITACGQQNSDGSNNSNTQSVSATDGKALFMSNCASCHYIAKDATGPALANILSRWNNDTAKLAAFIKDPMRSINEGGKDAYPSKLYEQWHHTTMPPFSGLTDAQIRSIIRYSNNSDPKGY